MLTVIAAWIVINFKLYAATGCRLFAIYATLLIVDISADIIYGMMFKIPAPAAITMGVINCMELLNLILNPLASVVLLLAWFNIKTPRQSKGSMEPGAEIKFRLRFMLTRGLNLGRARAFAEIKFHARMRCFVKDTASKTCPLAIHLRGASHKPYRRNPRQI